MYYTLLPLSLFVVYFKLLNGFDLDGVQLSNTMIQHNSSFFMLVQPDSNASILHAGDKSVTRLGVDVKTGDNVEMNFRLLDSNHSYERSEICSEFFVYQDIGHNDGIVNWYYCDFYDDKKAVLTVKELPGMSLAELVDDNCFSLKTITKIALQMVETLEAIHEKNYVYGNMSPFNIVRNIDNPERIKFTDFSLAKNYSARNVENRTEKLNHNDTRSMKYISLNEHNNLHLNPQQDIESMGYMLFELYWGELPWANSTDSNEVYELKKEINYYELLDRHAYFIAYMMNYGRDDKENVNKTVDYDDLRNRLIEPLVFAFGEDNDDIFWEITDCDCN